jgi:hypothetical protein
MNETTTTLTRAGFQSAKQGVKRSLFNGHTLVGQGLAQGIPVAPKSPEAMNVNRATPHIHVRVVDGVLEEVAATTGPGSGHR